VNFRGKRERETFQISHLSSPFPSPGAERKFPIIRTCDARLCDPELTVQSVRDPCTTYAIWTRANRPRVFPGEIFGACTRAFLRRIRAELILADPPERARRSLCVRVRSPTTGVRLSVRPARDRELSREGICSWFTWTRAFYRSADKPSFHGIHGNLETRFEMWRDFFFRPPRWKVQRAADVAWTRF